MTRAYRERQRELYQEMTDPSFIGSRSPEADVCEPRKDKVSRCKREIQNIVFENADQIPDGVYKQLMDALLIED
jgi:hypothetical protein